MFVRHLQRSDGRFPSAHRGEINHSDASFLSACVFWGEEKDDAFTCFLAFANFSDLFDSRLSPPPSSLQVFLSFPSPFFFYLKLHDVNILDANSLPTDWACGFMQTADSGAGLWFERPRLFFCFFFARRAVLSLWHSLPPAPQFPHPPALPAISSVSWKTSEKTYRIRAGDSLWGLWKKHCVPGKRRVPVYSRTTGSISGGAPPLVTRESQFMV